MALSLPTTDDKSLLFLFILFPFILSTKIPLHISLPAKTIQHKPMIFGIFILSYNALAVL